MAKRNKPPVVYEGQLEIADFSGREIRKVIHEGEWYFSVIDVVGAVSEGTDPEQDWAELRIALSEESGDESFENLKILEMPTVEGQSLPTDSADAETLFRIIQSIPSKKAERFKRWLARVGYDRIAEYENPEIAIKRAILEYKAKGYPDDWIERRVQSILVRQELTGEWEKRGVKGQEYGILANVIQEGTFDLGVQPHMKLKGLKKHHNLRDHMTGTELIFTMLGEASTKDIAVAKDAKGFYSNKGAATEGGKVAGDARRALEMQTKRPVVSESNFLPQSTGNKMLASDADQ